MEPDTEYKLGVERRLTTIETTLMEIKDNHLAHLDSKLNWILGLFVSALITLIFLLLSKYL